MVVTDGCSTQLADIETVTERRSAVGTELSSAREENGRSGRSQQMAPNQHPTPVATQKSRQA